MTYKEYIVNYVNDEIEKCGSLREFARRSNIHPSELCKIRKGKYVPKPKRFATLFPESNISGLEFDGDTIDLTVVHPEPIYINCLELDGLKRQLSKLGYAIEFKIYKKEA